MNLKNFIYIALFGLFFSCHSNRLHPVPSFQFDITLNLNLPTYQPLMGVGGWAYVNGVGSRGIIVYRRALNEFVAFDRHSPVDEEGTCNSPLVVDEENFLILNDPCSDARFSLFDGSIMSGNTAWGLRMYMTNFNGGDMVRIWNVGQ